MESVPQLIASYFTLAGNILPLAASTASPIPLAQRASAAAHAGYAGIGLHTDDLLDSVNRHGYAGVKSILNAVSYTHLTLPTILRV